MGTRPTAHRPTLLEHRRGPLRREPLRRSPAPPSRRRAALATAPFEEDPDPIVVAGRLRVAEARRTLAARQAAQRNARNRVRADRGPRGGPRRSRRGAPSQPFGRSRNKVDEAAAPSSTCSSSSGSPPTPRSSSPRGDPVGRRARGSWPRPKRRSRPQRRFARIVAERTEVQAAEDAAPADEEARWEEHSDTSAELPARRPGRGGARAGGRHHGRPDARRPGPQLARRAGGGARARDALLAERAALVEQLAALPDPNEVEELSRWLRSPGRRPSARGRGRGQRHRHPSREIAEANKALMAEEAEGRAGARGREGAGRDVGRAAGRRRHLVPVYPAGRPAGRRRPLILPILLDDPFVDFERDLNLPARLGRAVRRRRAGRARHRRSGASPSGPRRSVATGRGWWAPACNPGSDRVPPIVRGQPTPAEVQCLPSPRTRSVSWHRSEERGHRSRRVTSTSTDAA